MLVNSNGIDYCAAEILSNGAQRLGRDFESPRITVANPMMEGAAAFDEDQRLRFYVSDGGYDLSISRRDVAHTVRVPVYVCVCVCVVLVYVHV
jgi:hypothetical protein